ncbi:MAG TPA: cytochrome c3 family protein [Steroidobacteraceae bacterium]|nr:cytochrome c3 family protein [Steroidobacteraceae bacterium]
MTRARLPARPLLFTMLALCFALGSPAWAEEPASAETIPNEKCFRCHDDPEAENDEGASVAILASQFGAGAHKRLDCVTCHTDALTIKHPRNDLGPVSFDACVECHEEEIGPFHESVHAKERGDKPSSCQGCHGNVHTTPRSRDPLAPMSDVNQVRNCGSCHENMMEGYLSSVHARSLFVSGLTEAAPACSDCHGSHDIQRAEAPGARTSFAKSPETCGECHKGILKEWDESAHGALWRDGRTTGPVCSTCHEAHAVQDPTTVAMRQHMPSDCGNCHADLYKTFHDSFHGKATGVGHESAAMCSDCHTPHHNLPASDPRSSIHQDNLAATCGASNCHEGKVNASFLTFMPHSDPMDADQNPWVHYIYLFMTLLLLGVFGFFGVHAALWLQRTLVGRLRGEFKVEHFGPGPYVRRFTTTQIWLHVSIILSFLLLSVTGLPLKFSAAPWAPGLMKALGGPEVAGFLHRFAAIVTFGYFAVHLAMLFRDVVLRRQKGYFWGWRSMTPNLKDVQDLWANVKYFLYLGPRPALDRWAYWEKFDYLAVFWGVGMIGVSGLMLWLPDFFTRFLPGWALNAAYIIHSDEALLATGFIFLFHFFHTHLRPESFPMDPVIFTGSVPLHRFKEERPIEYQRLVDSNTLDKYFVPAPSSAHIQVAHVFGFAAVAIGVWLAFLIFRALASGAMHLF